MPTEIENRIEALEKEVFRNKSVSLQSITNFLDTSRGNFQFPKRDSLPATCRVGEVVEVAGTFYLATAKNTWTAVLSLIASLTAGEAISAGKAVAVSNGTTTTQSGGGGDANESLSTTNWFAQKFTTPAAPLVGLLTVTYRLTTTSSETFTVQIRTDNSGVPSSTVLDSTTAVLASGSQVEVDFSFSPLSLSTSTVYHAVVKTNGDGSKSEAVARNSTGTGQGTSKSTDSGVSWADNTGPLWYDFDFRTTTAGQIYNANSTSSNFRANQFIGFAPLGISSGSAGNVQISGVMSGLSGLTAGAIYYLNDTDGAIGTSAGSQSRKIGIALSATTLLIKHDNS